MINICRQCIHIRSEIMCRNCSGNPELVDNFMQKNIEPLKDNPNYRDPGNWIGNKVKWYSRNK